MDKDNLQRNLQAVNLRVEDLQQRASVNPLGWKEVMPETFLELQNSLEELRVAEEELRHQNDALGVACEATAAEHKRYQELFNFAPDGYLVTNPEAIIQEANQAAAERLHVGPEFLPGKPLQEYVVPEDRPLLRTQLARLLKGQEVQHWGMSLQPRGGLAFPVAVFVAPACTSQGNVASLRWLLHDLTDLKEAQQRSLQAERLAAIGMTVAGLAHESRNALQRSQACLEMLALEIQDRPQALELLSRLQRAQDDLHALFESVRVYAAPIKLQRRPCNLADIWREAWSHLEPLRKGRTANLHEQPTDVDLRCQADSFRLGQVFRNILENALAACHDPVEITLCCSLKEKDTQEFLQISVHDNGPGLTADQRLKIFNPFYTTKTRGTGLGMAIASRVMEAHGGTITVGEGEGPGTEIVLTLPRGDL